ncbi:MAG TPA: methionyl-tRNA formyltransferase, partial [Bacteroidia bacterium]|nr:methionyl-tRNA formyltransferase [Bacteroidia bacterium]
MGKSLRIIFMGTPEFAVATLDALVKSRHKVIAVITAPDKPASRGLKLQASAVKEYAVKNNIPVLQPEKLKNPDFISELKSLNADLQVVVAFRMLPEAVWAMPPLGTINLHASLLPQYRGAAPINWAIINGEKESGITTFFIQHEIDTGDILMQEHIPIDANEDAGSLHDKLMVSGAILIVQTLDNVADGNIKPIKQTQIAAGDLKSAPKIFRNNCRINWKQEASNIFNFVRGLSPYPGAWTEIQEEAEIKAEVENQKPKTLLKLYKCLAHPEIQMAVGTIAINAQNQLLVGCKQGAIEILELQAEG